MSFKHHYQEADKRDFDYNLYNWDVVEKILRGPSIDRRDDYFTALGAAEVFGRCVHEPFVQTIAKKKNLQGLNLGISGVGPAFYLDDRIIEVINAGKFCIITAMSTRSVDNSKMKSRKHDCAGICDFGVDPNEIASASPFIKRGNKRVFGKVNNFIDAYYYLYKHDKPAFFQLLAEAQINYLHSYMQLFKRIKVPIYFVFWSRKLPIDDGSELGIKPNNSLFAWRDFPHFLTKNMLEILKCSSAIYLEQLRNKDYTEYKYFEGYYPDQEEHDQLADNLIKVIQ